MLRVSRPLIRFWLLLAPLAIAGSSCKGRGCHGESEEEEEEEREQDRDNYWRAQVTIVGNGTVKTSLPAIDCSSDGTTQRGRCGPVLFKFKELAPPLLQASAGPGWRFDRWESLTREPDGATHPRPGRMPDGRFYLNGVGYADTGALETVTAVFVPAAPGAGSSNPK
jgi:hypothetical protein